jgi:hypothetical protein
MKNASDIQGSVIRELQTIWTEGLLVASIYPSILYPLAYSPQKTV